MIFNKQILSATLAISAVLSSVAATPINHHVHNVHRRNPEPEPAAVTVFVTHYYGADGSISTAQDNETSDVETSAAPAAAETTSSAAVAVTSSSTPVSAVTTSSSNVADAQSSSPSSSSSASASASSSSSSDDNAGSFAAGAKGIVYSPYKPGGCKTAAEVKADIAQLSEFSVIRIYGVDCDQVPNVLAALHSGQKVFLGIFDVTAIESGLSTIKSAIDSAGSGWSVVHTISIGNELVNNGEATVDQISGYMSTARSILKGYGYTGSIVSVDTFIATINNPGLCALSDYTAINAHAFFDGNIEASGSGDWLVEQIQRVWSACNSAGHAKTVFVTESGWPSKGDTNGVAVPSLENQEAAISSIKEKAGSDCILFTAFNDLWKADGANNAEKYYGIFGNSS